MLARGRSAEVRAPRVAWARLFRSVCACGAAQATAAGAVVIADRWWVASTKRWGNHPRLAEPEVSRWFDDRVRMWPFGISLGQAWLGASVARSGKGGDNLCR